MNRNEVKSPKKEIQWHEEQITKLVGANFIGAGPRIRFHAERRDYWKAKLAASRKPRLRLDHTTGGTVWNPNG